MKRVFMAAAVALSAMVCLVGCGGSAADSIEGSLVTKGQWDAAFSLFHGNASSFSVTETTSYTYEAADRTEEHLSASVSLDKEFSYVRSGGKEHVSGSKSYRVVGEAEECIREGIKIGALPENEETFIAEEVPSESGTTEYESFYDYAGSILYNPSEGGWTQVKNGDSPMEELLLALGKISASFSGLTYRAEEGGFVYELQEDEEPDPPKEDEEDPEDRERHVNTKLLVKFGTDSRLAAVVYTWEYHTRQEQETALRTVCTVEYLFTYGETAITLPIVG